MTTLRHYIDTITNIIMYFIYQLNYLHTQYKIFKFTTHIYARARTYI